MKRAEKIRLSVRRLTGGALAFSAAVVLGVSAPGMPVAAATAGTSETASAESREDAASPAFASERIGSFEEVSFDETLVNPFYTGDISAEDRGEEIASGETALSSEEASSGEAGLSDGEADLPSGEADLSDGELDLSSGEANLYDGEADLSDGELDLSSGEAIQSENGKTVSVDAADASTSDLLSESEAITFIRNAMKNRDETISLHIANLSKDTAGDKVMQIFRKAMDHTGVPTEGDYIYAQYHTAHLKTTGKFYYNGTSDVTADITVSYLSTAEEERVVDREVRSLLSSLNLDGLNDFQKIYKIYTWICQNVTYDYDDMNKSLDTEAGRMCHTAYSAIHNHTAVCQGYGSLFYRLVLEEGIDARYISGTSNGGGHGWNIVKIGGVYYDVDSTWDAAYLQQSASSRNGEARYPDYPEFDLYHCFLKSEADFTDHTRDDEFTTADFNAAYPMSPVSYTIQESDLSSKGTTGNTTKDPSRGTTGDQSGNTTGQGSSYRFTDVQNPSAYYFTPVYWAADKAITLGTSATTFSPNSPVTRAQFVTFLWRLDGKTPVPVTGQFRDLPNNTDFAGAISWAVQEGITTGTGDETFSPSGTVTRAQAVTFLYRLAGSPSVTLTDKFRDLPSSQTFAKAISWAVQEGITTGTSNETFSPNDPLTRGQAVRFLYLYNQRHD